MSISQNFPTVDPTLRLNFQGARRLDPRVTFTRASTATYVDEDGLIKTAGVNQARFDYDPATGESLGLLIEESRTNYLAFDASYDSNQGRFGNSPGSISYTISPTGENDAIIPVPDLTADRFETYIEPVNATAGDIWTFSWHEKNISYIGTEPVADPRTHVNLINVSSPQLVATYPNGWKRWSVTAEVETSSSEVRFRYYFGERIGIGNDNVAAFWGHQVEKGSFATSYIRANGEMVTRSADNAQITGTNFSSWYNQSEGTISVIFSSKGQSTVGYPGVFWFNNNLTGSRGFSLVKRTGPSTEIFQRGTDAILYNVVLQPISDNIFSKVTACYTDSQITGSHNGLPASSTNITSPYSINQLYIGYHNSGGGVEPLHLNSHIKQLLYYPERLTDSQLQNLTK